MSAIDERTPSTWPDESFWSRLDGLETQHRRAQSEHESVRRSLDALRRDGRTELEEVWKRYCEVIAELDRSTADLELFRTRGVG